MSGKLTKSAGRSGADHFLRLVSHWSHFGPPLRPSAADTRVIARIASELKATSRVVILGVTPETATCGWPSGTQLIALDHSVDMIRALWDRAHAPEKAEAIAADWFTMPLASRSIQAVVGDGCYAMFPYPAGFRALTREIDRVLRPDGVLAIRVYTRPEPAEPLHSVEAAFRAGTVPSVHALKLRLWAALHEATGPGTRLSDVWDVWEAWRQRPADSVVQGRRGWSIEELEGIEHYRLLPTRYFLPTVTEFESVLRERFEQVDCVWTDAGRSDRCPTFIAHKASAA